MTPVTNKRDMYVRLAAGEFGNTNPSWRIYTDWFIEAYKPGKLWGVRHTRISGFPGTRLNVPSEDVDKVIMEGKFGLDYNISPMVPGNVLWEGDVWLSDSGLCCSGTVGPENGSWRKHMLRPRLWERSAATRLLDQVCNANSRSDLGFLLDNYPGHVVEFSALDCCFGTLPDRNCVVWECRRY